MTSLRLPFPPSTNGLFMNKGKLRIRTKRYDAWRAEAGSMLLAQNPRKVSGRFDLSIQCERPDRRARDISNLIKAVEDLLVSHGVVEDDCLARTVTITWIDAIAKPAHAYAHVTALEAQVSAA